MDVKSMDVERMDVERTNITSINDIRYLCNLRKDPTIFDMFCNIMYHLRDIYKSRYVNYNKSEFPYTILNGVYIIDSTNKLHERTHGFAFDGVYYGLIDSAIDENLFIADITVTDTIIYLHNRRAASNDQILYGLCKIRLNNVCAFMQKLIPGLKPHQDTNAVIIEFTTLDGEKTHRYFPATIYGYLKPQFFGTAIIQYPHPITEYAINFVNVMLHDATPNILPTVADYVHAAKAIDYLCGWA